MSSVGTASLNLGLTYLANLPWSPAKEFGSNPDSEKGDDLSEIKQGGRTTERKDSEPVCRLDDPGTLQLVRDRLEVLVDDSNRFLARDLNDQFTNCART